MSVDLFLPCFYGLVFQKFNERIKLQCGVPSFQSIKISKTVFLVNNYGRMMMKNKNIIHQKSACSSVAVRKGMYILKLSMKIRGGG